MEMGQSEIYNEYKRCKDGEGLKDIDLIFF